MHTVMAATHGGAFAGCLLVGCASIRAAAISWAGTITTYAFEPAASPSAIASPGWRAYKPDASAPHNLRQSTA
jgi:hypothetical protein